jgi:hypothetical protein
MRCANPSCGHSNEPTNAFCTRCGRTLAQGVGERRCPNGHTIPASITDCPYCPRPVSARPGPATVPDLPGGTSVMGGGIGPGRPGGTVVIDRGVLAGSGVQPGPGHGPRPTPAAADVGPAGALSGGPKTQLWSTPLAAGAAQVSAPSGEQVLRVANGADIVGFLVQTVEGRGVAAWPLRLGRTRLGRDASCDVALDLPTVSANHAAIMVRRDQGLKIYIADTQSELGTRVNGREIHNGQPDLNHGDVVGISDVSLIVTLVPTPRSAQR